MHINVIGTRGLGNVWRRFEAVTHQGIVNDILADIENGKHLNSNFMQFQYKIFLRLMWGVDWYLSNTNVDILA